LITRRQLIRTGLAGSLLLATSGCLHRRALRPAATTGSVPADTPFLDADDRVAVAAISLVLLQAVPEIDTLGRQPFAERVTDGVEQAIKGLTPAVRDELRQLFDLLGFYPARRLLAGIGRSWRTAEAPEVEAFLIRWRDSRLQLLNSAYGALHQLVMAAWYGDEAAWTSIGYPGPPQLGRG